MLPFISSLMHEINVTVSVGMKLVSCGRAAQITANIMLWWRHDLDTFRITPSEKNPLTDSQRVHGANMGPTWVLSVPDGPHVGPVNFVIRGTPQRASNA